MSDFFISRVRLHGIQPVVFSRQGQESPAGTLHTNRKGMVCLPGDLVLQAIIEAAKRFRDPRDAGRSASDLYREGVLCLTEIAELGEARPLKKTGRAYCEDTELSRARPAFLSGWDASFEFLIHFPRHISPASFHDTILWAGQLIGVGELRPTYGRFQTTYFDAQSS